ncbi:hypothetical protein TIFTF001_011597, partial [Ficus carica]
MCLAPRLWSAGLGAASLEVAWASRDRGRGGIVGGRWGESRLEEGEIFGGCGGEPSQDRGQDSIGGVGGLDLAP